MALRQTPFVRKIRVDLSNDSRPWSVGGDHPPGNDLAVIGWMAAIFFVLSLLSLAWLAAPTALLWWIFIGVWPSP